MAPGRDIDPFHHARRTAGFRIVVMCLIHDARPALITTDPALKPSGLDYPRISVYRVAIACIFLSAVLLRIAMLGLKILPRRFC
jgi:hypothetical protein